MAAHYDVVPARGGKFIFRLRAANGEIILASQTYTARSSARRGVESVRRNCKYARCYERLKARNGKDYFVMKARNGQVIAKSQMYKTARAMENGIAAVKRDGKARIGAAG